MSTAIRGRRIWLLAFLIVLLAETIAVEKGNLSKIIYAGEPAAQRQADRAPKVIERAPIRFIKDPNPGYSSVAVDSDHHMLIATDENNFQIMEYDNKDNTPPKARLTEPKRIIGGTNTKAEYMCGSYIDPKTQEIYILNGDTQPWLPVFAPDARGNATPERYLRQGMVFQMAVNEERQEMYLAVQSGGIYVYRKQASGEEKPLRKIQGPQAQLADLHGIALDTKNNLIFVTGWGMGSKTGEDGIRYGTYEPPSIKVFPMLASGDVKPLHIIQGPKAMLNWPTHLALHEERQELYVANDADNSILVFSTTAEGDAAPLRVIKGAKTGLRSPTGLALDAKLGELFVTNYGTPAISVFPITADGDIPPIRMIRGGPVGTVGFGFGNPGGVAYDSKREQILVPN